MIIYLPLSGTAQILTPEHIYQGSNNINEVVVLSPLPSTTAVSVAFSLPTGTETLYYPTTFIGAVTGTELHEWRYTLENTILQYKGTVSVSVNTISTVGNRTSYSCDFLVEQSILPDLPASPSEDVYDDILLLLQNNSASIANILQALFDDDIPLVFDQDINARLGTAETDITALEGRVTVNEDDIDNLETADTTLQANIDAEELARINADGVLQDNIDAEELARQTADTTLQGNIDTEATTRGLADDALGVRVGSLEVQAGSADITPIAPTITDSLLSLNEDIDSLQEGVVPRLNRGIIEYASPTTTPDATLIGLMNDFIFSLFSRTPDNTDKITVLDNAGESENTYYSYNYWKGYDTLTDGWYWDSISVTDGVTTVESYTQSILLASWVDDGAGGWKIDILATTHGQGINNTVLIDLKKINTAGDYESIGLYDVDSDGNITIYSDTKFAGIIIVRTGDSYFNTTAVINKSQVIGLEADLATLQRNIDQKVEASNFKVTTIRLLVTNGENILKLALPDSGSITPKIYWGDGTTSTHTINFDDADGNITHTYAINTDYGTSQQVYVTVIGDFNGFYINDLSAIGAGRITEAYIADNCPIGNGAFAGCYFLKKVEFAANYTHNTIGNNAFYGCQNLESFIMHQNIRNLGDNCFYKCIQLYDLGEKLNIQTIGDNCFEDCQNIKEFKCSFTTSLGDNAFKGCANLSTLFFPYRATPVTLGTTIFSAGIFDAPKVTDLIITGGASQVQAEALRDTLISNSLTTYTNYRLLY